MFFRMCWKSETDACFPCHMCSSFHGLNYVSAHTAQRHHGISFRVPTGAPASGRLGVQPFLPILDFIFSAFIKKGHPHWHGSANEMSRAEYSPRGWRQDSTPQKLGCRRVCAHWEQSLHLSRGINRSRSLGNILAYCCSHHLNRETPAGLLAAL